ncbi:major histocompatibility complex class I-related gene protein-like [Sinocyclocheilus anshuiensis]|uniref:major histocompatibility complex class I-related gene protein-like n=1 Tax=Sinocyclocheilus anshuiensis TaxID=1608454 RepID=UPI0007BAD1A2|nr:PREDICTED: major histocompatibility complex class I-related gene protein-like [Sinocyclocheilus anshuiensis]
MYVSSQSAWVLITYIKGNTKFPEFSVTVMLDDITVGYYDSETSTYITRGNTTNEDDMYNLGDNTAIREHLYDHLVDKLRRENHTDSLVVYQILGLCELLDKDKSGQFIIKNAFSGSTTDELQYFDGKFTYNGPLKYTDQESDPVLQLLMWYHEVFSYPNCLNTLRSYLKKRGAQVKRKVKPRVRLIKKAFSDSGGFRVSCLATGFYPRHINLTLFRDKQPVADHEITGGDLLPNADGTYQMRKSLEIRAADKHRYTCSATHLSLDNKLDIDLECQGETFKQVISSVLVVLALGLVLMTVIGVFKWRRRRHSASSTSDYSSASTTEDNVDKT